MRRTLRLELSAETTRTLKGLTEQVMAAAEPKEEAARLWKGKPKAAFTEIRDTLRRMARGRERCMYCEDNEGTDIEHFWLKRDYPAKAFTWSNYLLACAHCNSNGKRDRFPMTDGEPDLIDPTDPSDDPANHLMLLPSNGRFQPMGRKGTTSIEVFDLNGDERGRRLPEGRKGTLRKLQLLLLDYDQWMRDGNEAEALATREAVVGEPFSAVLHYLVMIAQKPGGSSVLREGVAAAIQRYDVAAW